MIHYILQFLILVKCYEYLHPLVEPKQNIINQNIFDQDCSSDIFKKLQVQMNLQKACCCWILDNTKWMFKTMSHVFYILLYILYILYILLYNLYILYILYIL